MVRSFAVGEGTGQAPCPLRPPSPEVAKTTIRRAPSGLELGELVVAELLGQRGATVEGPGLAFAQFDPADLARDGLGQLVELEPAHPQVGREVLPCVAQDLPGGLGA